MEDLKKLLHSYEAVREELEGVKVKPEILREKVESLRKLLTELEGVTEAAHRRKGEALINFASGEISEAQLADAREHLNTVLRQKAEAQEFLEAAGKANSKIQKSIADLSQKLIGSRHVLFTEIASLLKTELPGDIGLRVNRIYSALNLAGGSGSYGAFLERLFPLAPHAERQTIERAILDEYSFTE